ncbi:hypothetical protein ABPG75_013567 [Micractinium tetrahymenae]
MAPRTRRSGASSAPTVVKEPMAAKGSREESHKAPKTKRGATGSGAGASAAAAEAAGQAEPPRQQKRSSKAPTKEAESKEQLPEEAGEGGEGSGEAAATEAPRRAKRHRKEVALPPPAALCFSPNSTVIRIGTSGYSYAHWRGGGSYYSGVPQSQEFAFYSQEFDMVELNATFYGWFKDAVWDSWHDRASAVRPSFEYVVKAQQFYSHRKRLNIDDAFTESWGRFWASCQRLRPHLGPVLFQFPTNFRTTSGKGEKAASNIDRLRRLGEVLPAGERFVFEFRDPSWFCQEVYDVLRQHDWCLAIVHCTDAPRGRKLEEGGWIGNLTPGPNPRPEEYLLDCCSWGAYVRFHGSEGQYRGAHGAAEMQRWADRAKQWAGGATGGRRVYFAFNNDSVPAPEQLPYAISDCRALAAALRSNGTWPD